MNEGVCFALGLITGLGIGCIAILAVRNRDRLHHEMEIQSVKDSYHNEMKRLRDAYHEAFSITSEEEVKKIIGPEKAENLKEANKRINYNKYASLVRDIPSEIVKGNEYEPIPLEGPNEDELEEEDDHPPEGGIQEPFVITPEEFSGEPEYEKEDLYYYIVSDTLVDEHDVEVEDIDRTIGYDNLRHMGEIEEGCLWVRNPNVMVDYQIVGLHGAWNGPG